MGNGVTLTAPYAIVMIKLKTNGDAEWVKAVRLTNTSPIEECYDGGYIVGGNLENLNYGAIIKYNSLGE